MPTNILDLPRELRDQIYGYILVSHTGYIAIVPNVYSGGKTERQYSKCTTKNRPSFTLRTNPVSTRKFQHRNGIYHANKPTYTSLSIIRVCRQIYYETQSIVWERNRLFFPVARPQGCKPGPHEATLGVIKTLKAMGQTASRRIVSIRIDMPSITNSQECSSFGKVLNVLASRARHGAFRYLELSWPKLTHRTEFGMLCLAQQRHFNGQHEALEEVKNYVALVEGLGHDREACRYERVIRLPGGYLLPDGRDLATICQNMDAVAEELHCAFGGKLFWGQQLGWENGEKIFSKEEEAIWRGSVNVDFSEQIVV
jgi:hypothetical protein